jgi:hypothetical protein
VFIDARDRTIGKYNTDEYSFERLMWDCCVCQPAAFWRRGIADLVGPFDEQLHFAMDYDYWFRIDRAGGRIMHLRQPLARSRVHPETKTQSRRAEIYAEIFGVCLKYGGYVSYNYFLGLWHHRLGRRRLQPPISVSRGRLGKMPTLLARAHFRWFHGVRKLKGHFRRVEQRIRGMLVRRSRSDAGRSLKRLRPPQW